MISTLDDSQPLTRQTDPLPGAEHPQTLTARVNLAASYRAAGRTGEAIAIEERVLAGFEGLLGAEHPDTLTARGNLAMAKRERNEKSPRD